MRKYKILAEQERLETFLESIRCQVYGALNFPMEKETLTDLAKLYLDLIVIIHKQRKKT